MAAVGILQPRDDPATAFVAEFVGIMNRIPGEMRAGGMVAVLGGAVPVKSPAEAPDAARSTCSCGRKG